MNWGSLVQAGACVGIYYAFWPVISDVLNSFTGGIGYWGPVVSFLVGGIPIIIFLGIAVGGVRDARR